MTETRRFWERVLALTTGLASAYVIVAPYFFDWAAGGRLVTFVAMIGLFLSGCIWYGANKKWDIAEKEED